MAPKFTATYAIGIFLPIYEVDQSKLKPQILFL